MDACMHACMYVCMYVMYVSNECMYECMCVSNIIRLSVGPIPIPCCKLKVKIKDFRGLKNKK